MRSAMSSPSSCMRRVHVERDRDRGVSCPLGAATTATIERWLRDARYADEQPNPSASCCPDHAMHRLVYWIDGTDHLNTRQRDHRGP